LKDEIFEEKKSLRFIRIFGFYRNKLGVFSKEDKELYINCLIDI
jgi:hypothetical protein